MDHTYPCPTCNKEFVRWGNYRNHLEIHRYGYDCPVCKKPHTSQDNLDIHTERQHGVSGKHKSTMVLYISPCKYQLIEILRIKIQY